MNRVLKAQLKEYEKNMEKTILLNPKTRNQFLKAKKEHEKREQYGRDYYRKTRLLG